MPDLNEPVPSCSTWDDCDAITSAGEEKSPPESDATKVQPKDVDLDIIQHSIQVKVSPEKKGLIFKHSEYEITSDRFGPKPVKVVRRYKDFITLFNYLVEKYPYRMIPNLPPKQLMMDHMLETRRHGLQNWLTVLCMHYVIGSCKLLEVFLTDSDPQYMLRLRTVYERLVDEFTRLKPEAELPLDSEERLASGREKLKTVLQAIHRLKVIFDQQVERARQQAKDMTDISLILRQLQSKEAYGFKLYDDMAFTTRDVASVSEGCAESQDRNVCDRIGLLLDVLKAHDDLCERVEKGVLAERQKALSKMVNINKQKLRTVIRGAEPENVSTLQQQEMDHNTELGILNRKAAFSLLCVLKETELVEGIVHNVPAILVVFANEQNELNAKIAEIWHSLLHDTTESS